MVDFLEAVDRSVEEVQVVVGKTFKYFIIIILVVILNCDQRKTAEDTLKDIINCQIVDACFSFSQYGMVGDSWTDFALGVKLADDLYDQLTTRYGYKITSSNIAGLTLRRELQERMGYIQVIKRAGPEIQFMLISLGGNDIIFPTSEYFTEGFEITIASRLNAYASRLRTLILYGNQLKISLYGGKPLKWIIHGYDYPNPILDNSCILSALDAEMPENEARELTQKVLDRFNEELRNLSYEIPDLYYIDLRGTLGGPPYSNSNWMTDCLHPNTLGFSLITDVYVQKLRVIENL